MKKKGRQNPTKLVLSFLQQKKCLTASHIRFQCKNLRINFTVFINRGIKHNFPFINICKVRREVFKTEGEARGFQQSQGTLRMLMNDKILFDRYYCINSATHCENEENSGALYFITIQYNTNILFKSHLLTLKRNRIKK